MRWNFLYFGLWPLALVWLLGTPEKSLGTILLASAFEIFIFTNDIPPQSSFPWAKQAQLLQSLLMREMLQITKHLCGLCWALCSSSLSFSYWGAQIEQITIGCGQTEGQNHLPQPVGHILPNAPQDLTGPPGHKGILPAHGQLVIHHNFQKCCISPNAALNPKKLLASVRVCPRDTQGTSQPPSCSQDPGAVEAHREFTGSTHCGWQLCWIWVLAASVAGRTHH